MKRFKKVFAMLLCAALMLGISITVYAAPAPSLTSVTITDVTADENDLVYIEVVERGTSSTRFVYCNNQLLQENINEMVSLDTNGDHIIDGYRRYFYTGYSVSDIYPGMQLVVRAQYKNAMQPWNTIYANRIFTFQ